MGRLAVACAAVLLMTMGGCSGSDVSAISTFERTADDGMFDQGLLEGTLVIDGGCLYIQESSSSKRYVPAFAEGSATWRDNVLSYRGKTYKVGDSVAAAGGGGGQSVKVASGCTSGASVWRVAPEIDLSGS